MLLSTAQLPKAAGSLLGRVGPDGGARINDELGDFPQRSTPCLQSPDPAGPSTDAEQIDVEGSVRGPSDSGNSHCTQVKAPFHVS